MAAKQFLLKQGGQPLIRASVKKTKKQYICSECQSNEEEGLVLKGLVRACLARRRAKDLAFKSVKRIYLCGEGKSKFYGGND